MNCLVQQSLPETTDEELIVLIEKTFTLLKTSCDWISKTFKIYF